jgi:hypothetical protein
MHASCKQSTCCCHLAFINRSRLPDCGSGESEQSPAFASDQWHRTTLFQMGLIPTGETGCLIHHSYFLASEPSHSCIRDYGLDHTNAIFDFQSQLLEAYISRINDHDDHVQSVCGPVGTSVLLGGLYEDEAIVSSFLDSHSHSCLLTMERQRERRLG